MQSDNPFGMRREPRKTKPPVSRTLWVVFGGMLAAFLLVTFFRNPKSAELHFLVGELHMDFFAPTNAAVSETSSPLPDHAASPPASPAVSATETVPNPPSTETAAATSPMPWHCNIYNSSSANTACKIPRGQTVDNLFVKAYIGHTGATNIRCSQFVPVIGGNDLDPDAARSFTPGDGVSVTLTSATWQPNAGCGSTVQGRVRITIAPTTTINDFNFIFLVKYLACNLNADGTSGPCNHETSTVYGSEDTITVINPNST